MIVYELIQDVFVFVRLFILSQDNVGEIKSNVANPSMY